MGETKKTDKGYEELLENYEDALMQLVMYQAAQEDGRRLLEEAEELERSGFEVPRELDEKCRRLIQAGCPLQEDNRGSAKAGPRKKSSDRRLTLGKIGEILAAAILAAVLLFCVAYAANEQFRVDVLNFFLEVRENGTWFSFGGGGTGEDNTGFPQNSGMDEELPFEFTYIPEGYEFIVQNINKNPNEINYFATYGDPDNGFKNFSFDIFPISSGSGLLVDTEDAEIKNVKIYGYDGQIIQKIDALSGEQEMIYIWFDLKNGLAFIFVSMGSSPEEAQKIFDGIVIDDQFLAGP